MAQVGKPLFLDQWTLSSSRIGYARVCVLMDLTKLVYLGVRVRVKELYYGNNLLMKIFLKFVMYVER